MRNVFCTMLAIVAVGGLFGSKRSRDRAAPRREPTTAPRLSVDLEMLENETFVIRLVNKSPQTIRLLAPLDGSEESLVMPYYALQIDDGKGTQFARASGRCAFFGHPYEDKHWPKDYLIELRPGESHKVTMLQPFVLPESGDYEVTFQYVFTPDSDVIKSHPPGQLKYPENLWRGTAKSRPLRVKLGAQTTVPVG